jgi:AcrR family transcriptional regulator
MESSQSEQKKQAVVEAALTLFGRNGYKKTSVSDIAAAAGISKAMVFHYFGSKKDLYMRLARFCGETLSSGVKEGFSTVSSDFFDRIVTASEVKISVLKEHPGLLSFAESLYRETDEAIAGEMRELMMREGETFKAENIFEGMDYSKFKEGIDPKLVIKLLVYFSEGCVNNTPRGKLLDVDSVMGEFHECVNLLRNNFYKEEFVK